MMTSCPLRIRLFDMPHFKRHLDLCTATDIMRLQCQQKGSLISSSPQIPRTTYTYLLAELTASVLTTYLKVLRLKSGLTYDCTTSTLLRIRAKGNINHKTLF